MFGGRRRLADGVEDRRALDHHGWLLVPWEMSDWWLVDAASGVYVDSVDHLISGLRVFLPLVLILVLS